MLQADTPWNNLTDSTVVKLKIYQHREGSPDQFTVRLQEWMMTSSLSAAIMMMSSSTLDAYKHCKQSG